MQINNHTWYSGTPEPDQFKWPPGAHSSFCNGGAALLLDIVGPRAIPTVTPLVTGRYRWRQIAWTKTGNFEVTRFEEDLGTFDVDPSRTDLALCFDGMAADPVIRRPPRDVAAPRHAINGDVADQRRPGAEVAIRSESETLPRAGQLI
jgi:hypothetical protein